jgi:hydrogenase maturation protease
MNAGRLMVIGIGNPDRGDDGIGAAVVEAIRAHLPQDVEVKLRTGDMLALVEDWAGMDAVICIDAAASLGAPGRVHRIDARAESILPEPGLASSHAFGLAEAIGLSRALGTMPDTLIVVAVEGDRFDTGAPVSATVASAVEAAAGQVLAEVERLRPLALEAAHA